MLPNRPKFPKIVACIALGLIALLLAIVSPSPIQATSSGGSIDHYPAFPIADNQAEISPLAWEVTTRCHPRCILAETRMPLVAITPPAQYEKTAKASPEIVVYIDKGVSGYLDTLIINSDSKEEAGESQLFALTNNQEPRLFTVPLLPDGSTLAPGNYEWGLQIICDPDDPSSAAIFTLGKIEVVDDLDGDPASLTPGNAEFTEWALQNHLGIDALAEAVKVRNARPEVWSSLVDSLPLHDRDRTVFKETSFFGEMVEAKDLPSKTKDFQETKQRSKC
ncbi:MAG: DUF928 domain-containing protein [Cyanobacteria bacterium P01_D01_bin.73]